MQKRLNFIQEQFVNAIRGCDNSLSESITPIAQLSTEACLNIYRRGYGARLTEALSDTFEATWWVLGDEDFFELCARYIEKTPSHVYDLSDYGADFPEFLSAERQSDEIQFLSDLAKFEWAFKAVFHSANIEKSTNEDLLNGLSESLKLTLSPSVVLINSRFSVYEIWKRRATPITELSSVDLTKPENLLLYKKESQVYVQKLDNDEFLLIQSLGQGHSLEGSIDLLVGQNIGISPSRIQEIFATIGQLNVLSVK